MGFMCNFCFRYPELAHLGKPESPNLSAVVTEARKEQAYGVVL
jgi:hypothetical protein